MSCTNSYHSENVNHKRFEYSELHMGVQVRLVIYHDDEQFVRRVAAKAFKEANRLDNLLSDYKPESELSQLGARAYPSASEVSPELFELLSLSKSLFERTDGLFDVSSGELFKLWRRSAKKSELPDQNKIALAKSRAGMDNVFLDKESSMVLLKKPNMQFDLGAIAKGYASERLLEIFRLNNLSVVFIDFGGALAIGDSPSDSPWRVIIDGQNRQFSNVFISTSGSTFQHLEIDGKVYSHLINPENGQGIQGNWTVTVVASSGARADAISTALSLMPRNKWAALIGQMNSLEVIKHQ